MVAPLGKTLEYLKDKVGYPVAAAVVRALRVLGYGVAVWLADQAVANTDLLDGRVSVEYKFLIVTLLVGLDKFLRARKAEEEG